MAYTKLSEEGKRFIRKVCNGSGNSFLQGKSPYKTKNNPHGVLPYCIPPTSPTYIWAGHPKFNGVPITTNDELANAIINWYDKYAKIYEIDANVVAAQGYQESGYKIWNYALTSTASGISQFIVEAVLSYIIWNIGVSPGFTTDEINAITKNIIGENGAATPTEKKSESTYSVSTTLGKKNRPILHQNIIDNPEIMIKAQCRYMRNNANKNSLASVSLFGYSRGPGYIKKTYTESIQSATNGKYTTEGSSIDNGTCSENDVIYFTLAGGSTSGTYDDYIAIETS